MEVDDLLVLYGRRLLYLKLKAPWTRWQGCQAVEGDDALGGFIYGVSRESGMIWAGLQTIQEVSRYRNGTSLVTGANWDVLCAVWGDESTMGGGGHGMCYVGGIPGGCKEWWDVMSRSISQVLQARGRVMSSTTGVLNKSRSEARTLNLYLKISMRSCSSCFMYFFALSLLIGNVAFTIAEGP